MPPSAEVCSRTGYHDGSPPDIACLELIVAALLAHLLGARLLPVGVNNAGTVKQELCGNASVDAIRHKGASRRVADNE
jgi:hypothetical protein